MKRVVSIKHEFVEFIPQERQEGVLYVSIPYATAVHNCLCGCGLKVVTPISPVGWQLGELMARLSKHCKALGRPKTGASFRSR